MNNLKRNHPPAFKFPSSFPTPGLLAAGMALTVWAGFSGCKPVEIDAPASDTTAVIKDSALVRVTNLIAVDPDSITMVLYSGNSLDITNAREIKRLRGVAYKATVSMKVPVGEWKLAYADHAGILVPMIDPASASQDWVKSIFAKNGDYSLIIGSDGDFTTWEATFETDPPME